jgi:hypothetical protein
MQTCLRTLSTVDVLVRGVKISGGDDAHTADAECAQVLLRMLMRLLLRLRDDPERVVGRRLGVRVPPLAQAVEWVSLVLDSHAAALILTPAAHPLLASLQALLAEHVAVCRAASSLRGYVAALAQAPTARIAPAETGDYRIEVLQL